MRLKALVYATLIVACALSVGDGFTRAQTSVTFDSIVKQSLFSLIAELQTKIARQAAGDQSATRSAGQHQSGPEVLGTAIKILFSAPVASQGLFNFNARVIQENGISEWSLRRVGYRPNSHLHVRNFWTSAHPLAHLVRTIHWCKTLVRFLAAI